VGTVVAKSARATLQRSNSKERIMSIGVNNAILIGHLGADPELRATPSGQAVAEMRLATSRKWNDKHGTPQEDTQWHRVVVWDKLATTCHRYLQKGSQVYVDGRIQNRKYVDKEGHDRYVSEIIARNVVFLGSPRRAEAPAEGDPTRQW
jgi:single-strand DNA-binding protein